MKTTKWQSYHELAWIEPIIAPPEEYSAETERLCKIVKEFSRNEVKTLLHLGCGAGGNDFTFKKHFKTTGVDISNEMLVMARRLNPEVLYINGDMRDIQLGERFDAVAIPDSIGYMTTTTDLQRVLDCAFRHLNHNGTLMVIATTSNQFRENNFVYTGTRGDIEVSIFENNYITNRQRTKYEATLVYLVRNKGKLEIYTDCHELGIITLRVWLKLLDEAGFVDIDRLNLDDSYKENVVGEGEYPQTIFVCRRR